MIVLCNGLWGMAKHWSSVREALEEQLQRREVHCQYHIHVSTSNQLLATYDGIDVCGSRLAHELECVVDKSFDKISFIGHSQGGLIARNAVKKMYDKDSRTILGLEPCHFVTLATPHVGFVNHPEEDVPLARWIKGFLPLGTKKIVDLAVPLITSYVLGEAGKQFFYRDQQRILYTMSKDPWTASLTSFKTRTLYANMDGDHLVGWGNSSIRSKEDMESVEVDHGVERRGIVRMDPIESSWLTPDPPPRNLKDNDTNENLDFAYLQQQAMENLKSIGWRRIDVSYKDSRLWYLSHQHIMVQRPFVNSIGLATARHIAEQIYILELHTS